MAPPLNIVRMQIQLPPSACANTYNVRQHVIQSMAIINAVVWFDLAWFIRFGSLTVSNSKIGIPGNTTRTIRPS